MPKARNRLMLCGQVVMVLVAMAACSGAPTTSNLPVPSDTASPDTPSVSGSPLPSQTTASAPAPSQSPTAVGQSTKPAVKLTQPAKAAGFTVRLTGLKAIKSKGRGPGEVSGPALRVDVRLTNGTSKAFDASAVVVTLLDSRNDPGAEMLGPPHAPMRAIVKPGDSVGGVWVFNVPTNRRDPVKILVTLPTDAPVLLFSGRAPS